MGPGVRARRAPCPPVGQPARAGRAGAGLRARGGAGLAQAGLLRGRTVDQLLAALEPVGRMDDALRDADYVQESTPERLDSKRRVYAELDRLAPAGAILASSTSALLPSHFTADLPGRARCLVAHPINPPYLVPAVEIVPAPWTDAACVERARSLLAEAGQQPIVMRREIDGFVVNRLQARCCTRRSGWWPTAMPASRTWTPASATVCAALGLHGPVRDHRPERPGRRARLRRTLRRHVRRDVRVHDPARALERRHAGPRRGAAPRAFARRRAGPAPDLARPAPDGTGRAQGAAAPGRSRLEPHSPSDC